MKLFKRKQQIKEEPKRQLEMKKVYTDKAGNDWYEYANPLQLPAKRAIAAEVATRFAEMNLTKEMLMNVFTEMKKCANDGDIVTLFSLLNEVEFRLNFIGEEQTLMELASCYFVIGDEDETDFSEIAKKKKMDILQDDLDTRSFFIKGAFEYIMKYSSLSDVDILDYLKANAPNVERLNRLMQERLSRSTSTT